MTVITSKAIRTYLLAVKSLRIMRALSHPYSKIITSNDQGKKTVITVADKILLHMLPLYFLFRLVRLSILVDSKKNPLKSGLRRSVHADGSVK